MKTLRLVLTYVASLLLVLGYAASQKAFFGGTASEHAAKMDQPQIKMLAAIFLCAAIVLHFIPECEAETT